MRKKKLSRKKDQRKTLIKSLLRELILREKIQTTKARAKVLFDVCQKVIEKAKKQKESQKVKILKYLPLEARKKLFSELLERYKNRTGGYLRILKLGKRKSDGAEICQVELLK